MRLRKTGSILVLSCSLAAASLDEPLNTGTHRSPTRSARPHEGEDAWNGCSASGCKTLAMQAERGRGSPAGLDGNICAGTVRT